MWTLLLICLLADEGMWPYNQFPKDKVGVTTEFLDNLRLASVQIAGGSGAFVSPKGLILTNQHLIVNCLGDRVKDGFRGPEELKCPGLTANVLLSIEDVSTRIEKGCTDKCEVVKLFSGGRYDLYRYKTYSDIRLVFAPEYQLAFFGRERDSITYLRYGLDAAFLRAYENGKPAATPHFLKWSTDGVREGDFVFAAGNPAPTARSTTAAQLTFYRDTALPLTLNRLMPRIKVLPEGPVLTSLLTQYKIAAGKLIGLRDDRLVARKTIFEAKIRHAVERDPAFGMAGGKVWDEVANAYKNWAPFEWPYQILEGSPFRSEPVNEHVEILMLTIYLEELQKLGDKETPIKKILDGKTPQQAAEQFVKTRTVENLVTLLEPAAKRLKKKHDDMTRSIETATGKIAQYRFKLFSAADYPDATSTPRVEFGTVKGYVDRAGVPAPYAATFSGLFYRVNDAGPYSVPKRWVDGRASLNQVTPLDFVSMCDIGGGDYGSPVVNRAGELVGVTFDGNLESLPDTYLYTNEGARAVHVAAQGIEEALEKIYHATALLEELGLGARTAPHTSAVVQWR